MSNANTPPKMISIMWAPQEGRSSAYAAHLGIPIFNVHYLKYKQPLYAPFKYVLQWIKTWQILFKESPKYIYVTNPPPFAALCVYFYTRMTGSQYVMDTHPPVLYSKKWSWSLPLSRFLAKNACMNIIDQDRFAKMIESWGGKAVVLENSSKGSTFGELAKLNGNSADAFIITVINTFAEDEPLDPILDAAKQLPNARFYITGDKKRAAPGVIENAPQNVVFTDYLRGKDYWDRLNSSHAVMALTTFPFSLMMGAQDGMMLSKPLLVSDQPAMRDYFTKGTVFAENTAEGLIKGVHALQQQQQTLMQEIGQLNSEHKHKWDTNFKRLLEAVERA